MRNTLPSNTKPIVSAASVVGLLGLLLTGPAIASNPTYMTGCVFHPNGLLPLQSVHYEFERPEDSGPEFEGMRVVRKVDHWSQAIIQRLTSGQHCPDLKIDVYADEDKTRLLWQVEFSAASFVHRKEWISEGMPHEALQIMPIDEVTWKYFSDDDSVQQYCWDFRTNNQC